MPKNNADAKYSRENNEADSKNNLQNNASLMEEAQSLTSNNTADYVPSLNGISKEQG